MRPQGSRTDFLNAIHGKPVPARLGPNPPSPFRPWQFTQSLNSVAPLRASPLRTSALGGVGATDDCAADCAAERTAAVERLTRMMRAPWIVLLMSAPSSAAQAYQRLPEISEGKQLAQRIGSKIKALPAIHRS